MKNIAESTIGGFSLDNFLKSYLGMMDGNGQKIVALDADGKNVIQSITEWLGYGGVQEDRPGSILDYLSGKPSRSNNHFHNPLRAWEEAGLNDVVLGVSYTGQSQVLWAQNPNQTLGGNWSWQDARRYFYIALTGLNLDGTTVAATSADKDAYYAYRGSAVKPEDKLGFPFEAK